MNKLRFFIFLSVLLYSCSSTKNLTFEIVQPAKIFFEEPISDILLIKNNLTDSVTNTYRNYSMEISGKECITAFMETLQKSPLSFDSIILYEGKITDSASVKKNISDIYLKNHKINIIIVLNDFYLTNDTIVFYDQFYGYSVSKWLIIGRSLTPHELVTTDTAYISYDYLQRNFKENDSINYSMHALKLLGYWHGEKAAKKISPYWEEIHRRYYLAPNRDFMLAHDHIKKGEIEEAASLYRNHVYSENISRKFKACYNLAVLSEYAGMVSNAQMWLKELQGLQLSSWRKKQLVDYFILLNKRTYNNNLLDYQLHYKSRDSIPSR